jgi:hypothetical protein
MCASCFALFALLLLVQIVVVIEHFHVFDHQLLVKLVLQEILHHATTIAFALTVIAFGVGNNGE